MDVHCLLCGGCADICPIGCIEIVAKAALISAPQMGDYSSSHERTNHEDKSMVLVKDESGCIRCGLCVEQCPTGVMAYV